MNHYHGPNVLLCLIPERDVTRKIQFLVTLCHTELILVNPRNPPTSLVGVSGGDRSGRRHHVHILLDFYNFALIPHDEVLPKMGQSKDLKHHVYVADLMYIVIYIMKFCSMCNSHVFSGVCLVSAVAEVTNSNMV